MKGRNTYVLSARVPDALYKRVKKLADKRDMTPNDWLKNIIIAAAKYKENDHKDHEPPVNAPTALMVVEEVVPDKEDMFDDREEV